MVEMVEGVKLVVVNGSRKMAVYLVWYIHPSRCETVILKLINLIKQLLITINKQIETFVDSRLLF